jgi:4-alpha-glucanotransferase
MLVDALAREGCIDEASAARLREDAAVGGTAAVGATLSEGLHRFLARTPSMLKIVAIDDVLWEIESVNVPGTVDEHPNWQRKRSLPLEALDGDGRLFRIGAVMCDTEAVTYRLEAR